MKKKYYWIVGIVIFALIVYLSASGIQAISTDKNVYSLGEEVKIHWSDFSLQWESCNSRAVKIYKQEATSWKRISYELLTFGSPACVNGEMSGGAYPCDVSSFQIPSKIFESGNISWNSKIYEYKGETDSCLDTRKNEIINYTMSSYEFKEAPAGKYKLSFGSAEKIIEIR